MFDDSQPIPFPPERLQALADELERKLEKIGCYVRNIALNVPQDEDGNQAGDAFLIVTCQIGSVAWSPRVQDPEQDKVDDEFRGLASDSVEEQFEEIRRKEREKRQRGETTDPGTKGTG